MKTSQTRSFLIGSLSLAVIADGVAAEADNPVFGRLRRRHKIKNKSFSSPVPRFGVDSAPVCRLGLHLEPYPGRRPESPGNFTTPDSIGKSLTGTPSRSLCNSLIENQPETLIQKKTKKKTPFTNSGKNDGPNTERISIRECISPSKMTEIS